MNTPVPIFAQTFIKGALNSQNPLYKLIPYLVLIASMFIFKGMHLTELLYLQSLPISRSLILYTTAVKLA